MGVTAISRLNFLIIREHFAEITLDKSSLRNSFLHTKAMRPMPPLWKRKECTIPAVAMHHHPRSSCTFGAAYATYFVKSIR